MKSLVLNQSGERISKKWLERWLKGLARQLALRKHKGLAAKELVVVFVSSPEMKKMNKMYRGKNYATDILSFEPVEPNALGELVLCLPTIRTQALRTGLSLQGELGYMIVHGVLHLLGYDHGEKASEAHMFALQDEIFHKLTTTVGLR